MGRLAAAAHLVLEGVSPAEDVNVVAAAAVDLVHAPVRRLEVCSGGLPRPLVIGAEGLRRAGGQVGGRGELQHVRAGGGCVTSVSSLLLDHAPTQFACPLTMCVRHVHACVCVAACVHLCRRQLSRSATRALQHALDPITAESHAMLLLPHTFFARSCRRRKAPNCRLYCSILLLFLSSSSLGRYSSANTPSSHATTSLTWAGCGAGGAVWRG